MFHVIDKLQYYLSQHFPEYIMCIPKCSFSMMTLVLYTYISLSILIYKEMIKERRNETIRKISKSCDYCKCLFIITLEYTENIDTCGTRHFNKFAIINRRVIRE